MRCYFFRCDDLLNECEAQGVVKDCPCDAFRVGANPLCDALDFPVVGQRAGVFTAGCFDFKDVAGVVVPTIKG